MKGFLDIFSKSKAIFLTTAFFASLSPSFLSADLSMGKNGEPVMFENSFWHPAVLSTDNYVCEVSFPVEISTQFYGDFCVIEGECDGNFYALASSLYPSDFPQTAEEFVAILESDEELQSNHAKIQIIDHNLENIHYIVEIQFVDEEGPYIERIYCDYNGQSYHQMILGETPLLHFFDTFSLKNPKR